MVGLVWDTAYNETIGWFLTDVDLNQKIWLKRSPQLLEDIYIYIYTICSTKGIEEVFISVFQLFFRLWRLRATTWFLSVSWLNMSGSEPNFLLGVHHRQILLPKPFFVSWGIYLSYDSWSQKQFLIWKNFQIKNKRSTKNHRFGAKFLGVPVVFRCGSRVLRLWLVGECQILKVGVLPSCRGVKLNEVRDEFVWEMLGNSLSVIRCSLGSCWNVLSSRSLWWFCRIL